MQSTSSQDCAEGPQGAIQGIFGPSVIYTSKKSHPFIESSYLPSLVTEEKIYTHIM